jgi:hypothetical protein
MHAWGLTLNVFRIISLFYFSQFNLILAIQFWTFFYCNVGIQGRSGGFFVADREDITTKRSPKFPQTAARTVNLDEQAKRERSSNFRNTG